MNSRENYSIGVYYTSSSTSCYNRNQCNNVVGSVPSPTFARSHRNVLINYSEDQISAENYFTPAGDTESEQMSCRVRGQMRLNNNIGPLNAYNMKNRNKGYYTNRNIYNVYANTVIRDNQGYQNCERFPYNNRKYLGRRQNSANNEESAKHQEDGPRKACRLKCPQVHVEEGNYSEKMTYCRPVTEYYNQEYIYKIVENKKKLKMLVKKLAEAREREKQKTAWEDYINQLKTKHEMAEGKQPTTSKAQRPPKSQIARESLEDLYNTRYKMASSNHCKILLRDLYSSTMNADRVPTQAQKIENISIQNKRPGNIIAGNDYFTDGPAANSHYISHNTPTNHTIENNNLPFIKKVNPYLGLSIRPHNATQIPYFSYPCSSTGRMLKQNASNSCDLGTPDSRTFNYSKRSKQKPASIQTTFGDSRTNQDRISFSKTNTKSRVNANRTTSSGPRKVKKPHNIKVKTLCKQPKCKAAHARPCNNVNCLMRHSSNSSQNTNSSRESLVAEKNTQVCPQICPPHIDDSTDMSLENKINELRDIKYTEHLSQVDIKNIENKLDVLITQMHSLLSKRESISKLRICPASKRVSYSNVPVQTATPKCTEQSCQNDKCSNITLSPLNNKSCYGNKPCRGTKTEILNINDLLDPQTLHPHTFSFNVSTHHSCENIDEHSIAEVADKFNSWKNTSSYSDAFIRDTTANKSSTSIKDSYTKMNTKIDEILIEEMDKSDKAKRDIEGILNGDSTRPYGVQIMIDVPTRERCTEITNSLSKAKIQENASVESDKLVSVHSKRPIKRITIAVNTDPLGLLALLHISTATIRRLLSFVHFDYQSILPLPMPRPLSRPIVNTCYTCNICDSGFRKSTDLSEHIRAHQLQSSKDCCVCRHLLEMGRNHRRKLLFKCRYCGKTFTRAYCCELHEQNCAKGKGQQHDLPESLSILS